MAEKKKKNCIKCNQLKDQKEFYKNFNKCKTCVIKQTKLWKQNNTNKVKDQKERYKTNNPIERYVSNLNSAYKRKTGVEQKISVKDFKYILIQFNDQCSYCCKDLKFGDKDFTTDHIISISNGGENTFKNICVACLKCNSKKGKKDIDRFLAEKLTA